MSETIALISDSHRLIRPEVEPYLENAAHVIHAGDVGTYETLKRFEILNPHTTFVCGNTDYDPGVASLPMVRRLQLFGFSFYVIHDLASAAKGDTTQSDFVIFGHSHMPETFTRDSTVFINPGSIGPARFKLPVSLALLIIDKNRKWELKFITL
ncbi:MAG: metallophosphoesterase family protein [Fibrobacterota bacterium]